MLEWLSRSVFFPLWEIKDGAVRLKHFRELCASQWRAPEQIRVAQWSQAREIVRYAFENCEFYRRRYTSVGFDGRIESDGDFSRLPVVTKMDIRADGEAFLSRAYRREDLVEARTGGSTGTSLVLHFDERCQEMRNAAAMRSDCWAGWDIGMRVAAIWGNPPVAKTIKQKLRSLLRDRIFYLDTMDLNEASIGRFVDRWRRMQPKIMFGHSHSIYILAAYLDRMGITDLRPRGIVTTSMMLLEPERQVIERVFQCACTNRYGCEEVGLIACECEEHRGMHLNADHVIVEFLRADGTEAQPGEEGDIVVTDLINRGMPLIRYRVEDLGVPSARRCPCGRGLPLMERVVGRQADFLKRPDGSLVAGVSLVERTLTAIPGIEQMQIVQEELGRIQIKVVRGKDYGADSENRLTSEFNSAFGSKVSVEICYVRELEKTGAGKYRFSICKI
jgi:phenylacetate-CoA ligase